MEDVVHDRLDKALAGAGALGGGGRTALSGTGGEACLGLQRRQRLGEGLVHPGVKFVGGKVRAVGGPLDNQRIGPVVAVVHDPAAGHAAAKGDALGGGGFNLLVALTVAEGDGGLRPAVVAKGDTSFGERVEEGGIDRHVGGGIAEGVGKGYEHCRWKMGDRRWEYGDSGGQILWCARLSGAGCGGEVEKGYRTSSGAPVKRARHVESCARRALARSG